jgi:hypothetical protein
VACSHVPRLEEEELHNSPIKLNFTFKQFQKQNIITAGYSEQAKAQQSWSPVQLMTAEKTMTDFLQTTQSDMYDSINIPYFATCDTSALF